MPGNLSKASLVKCQEKDGWHTRHQLLPYVLGPPSSVYLFSFSFHEIERPELSLRLRDWETHRHNTPFVHRTRIGQSPNYCRFKNNTARMLYSVPLLALLPIAIAGPHYPLITPPPSLTDRDRRLQERGVVSSVISDATSDIAGLGSYLSSVVGTYPPYIASGVPNFFQNFPTGSDVQSSLGISDSDLAATPTQVLNIP